MIKIIKKSLTKLAEIQDKYPLLVILFVLTITSFFLYYAVRLETDSSFDVMFRDDSESQRLERLVDSEFGGTDTMFVLIKIDQDINDKTAVNDIRHPDVFKALNSLKTSLESETFVNSAQSLSDLLLSVYGKTPSSLEESKIMINNLPQEFKDTYLKSTLSSDYQFQNMLISVSIEDTPGSIKKIEDNIREKIDQTPFPIGVEAELTGLPVLYNRILNFLINDNMRTVLFALMGVFFVLWFYFKSWKIALISTVPTLLTLTWLAGTMHLIGIRITVITASVGAIMIGMSVDYAIHLTHRFHKNVKEGHKAVTKNTVVGVGSALFASVITTIAGFLAMLLGISPNSQIQGKVLAIGIAFAFIISILILPALMTIQRKLIYTKLDETLFRIAGRRKKEIKSPIDKFLLNLAKFQVKSPWFVLLIALIATLLIVPGFGLVYLDVDDENWVPEKDEVVEAMNVVGNNFGGTDSMNLLFMVDGNNQEMFDASSVRDLRDPRAILPMASLDKLVEDLKWVNSVDSPTNSIRQYNQGRVPRDFEEIKRVIEENPEIKQDFNDDFSIAKFTVRADLIDRPEFYELMDELNGVVFPRSIAIVPQGSIPQDIEFEQVMQSDTMKTAGLGFLLVIIVASLFYLSILSGFLAFIPIVFAILWTVGLMGYINLPFTVLTTGMLAILMGIGIDFSIHLIHSIRESMEDYDNDIKKAVPYAMMGTGQAISITTITTVIGFMALSFATLVNTMRLGWTLGLGIACTFFACTVIVPSVLVIQYRRKIKKQLSRR